jgi:hypothetical protein
MASGAVELSHREHVHHAMQPRTPFVFRMVTTCRAESALQANLSTECSTNPRRKQ